MVASIANFDEPKKYAPVRFKKSMGIQTDGSVDGSDIESGGEISISIQADLNPSSSIARKSVEKDRSKGKLKFMPIQF